MTDTAPAIELKGISKAFGPVQANKDISIRVMPGTIHGIIGENGAGKSTLMSILYGFYKADRGEIFINGTKTEIPDSQAAIAAGIGMVFQHFKLVENFTVVENVILGAEDGPMLTPSIAKARRSLKQLAEEYELNVDPDALIEDLSVGHQQRVEVGVAQAGRVQRGDHHPRHPGSNQRISTRWVATGVTAWLQSDISSTAFCR